MNISKNNRFHGGWIDEMYNALSWTLSCLRLKHHYGNVELSTDKKGYEFLIERLKLPYSKADLQLEDIAQVNTQLWAFGKLYTYSIQKKPFIHIDGDFYIWDKFPNWFENSELVGQHYEFYPVYNRLLTTIFEKYSYIPSVFDKNQATAVNAGVIGGTNYKFYREAFLEIQHFINRNDDVIKNELGSEINIIIEQYFLYRCAVDRGLDYKFLFAERADCLNINLVPHDESYVHLLGPSKKNISYCKQLEFLLKFEFPEYYLRLYSLFKPKTSSPTSLFNWQENEQRQYRNLIKWRSYKSNEVLSIQFVLSDSVRFQEDDNQRTVMTYQCPYTLFDQTVFLEGLEMIIMYFDKPYTINEITKFIEGVELRSNLEQESIKKNILKFITYNMSILGTININ